MGCAVTTKRLQRRPNNGFSKGDPRSEWEKIRIPAVMVSKENGKRIHDMMDLESMEAFGGVHFYDRLLNDE